MAHAAEGRVARVNGTERLLRDIEIGEPAVESAAQCDGTRRNGLVGQAYGDLGGLAKFAATED